MIQRILKILALVIIGGFLLSSTGCDEIDVSDVSESNLAYSMRLTAGYLGAEYNSDNHFFIAVGTGGRITKFYEDGSVRELESGTAKNLSGVYTSGNLIIVSGEGGTILYSKDGETFEPAGTGGMTGSIFSITSFKGIYLAGASRGIILTSPNGVDWIPQASGVNGDIISIDANNNFIMAITEETDVLISTDGLNWEIENFNEVYEGFYPEFQFRRIKSISPVFFLLGQRKEEPGIPFLFSTGTGEIWMPICLEMINDEFHDYEASPVTVHDTVTFSGELLVAASGGRILRIDDCARCNKSGGYMKSDIYAMATGGNKVLIAGRDFEYKIIREMEDDCDVC